MPVEGRLRFQVRGESLALRLDDVDGLAEPRSIRPVPGASGRIAGLAEWHGSLLTVLDLERLLDLPTGDALPCLVRLAPPFRHVAILLRYPVELDVDPWTGPSGPLDGVDRQEPSREPRLLEPAALLRLAEADG